MQGIDSIPILSLEWFVTFSEVVLIFLHMLSVGIKKGLLLFPSATLKTHLWRLMQLLQYGQQEYNRCYLRLWFLNLSPTPKGAPIPYSSNRTLCSPINKLWELIPQVFIPILAVVFFRFLPFLMRCMWINSASGSIPVTHSHSTRKSVKYAKFLL